MEESDAKHMCRFCNKSFPCGRSLGGHMRSHVINSTDHHHHHHHHHHQVKNKSCLNVLDKLCKECGKGFQSWKALFGHMKCHSIKLSNNKNKNTASLNQDSWTSNSENEDLDAKKRRIKRSRSRSGSRNRGNKRCIVTTASSSISMNVDYNQISSNYASTSMVSEIEHEQDQEQQVAMSLMMLQRDLGTWGKELVSSDNCYNSSVFVEVEGKDSIKNHCKMNKFAETEADSDFVGRSEVGLTKISEFDSNLGDYKNSNNRKFECVACNKSFHSLQALCGHKASHQKLKRDFVAKIQHESKIEHKPMLDHDQTINGYDSRTSNDHQESSSFSLDAGSLKKKTVVLRAHECSICFKVFTSGQALGGHKRSHAVSEAKLNQEDNSKVIKKRDELVRATRGFLDLNMLPAEEVNMSSSTTEYKSFCWEDSSDHQSHESRILCLLSTS